MSATEQTPVRPVRGPLFNMVAAGSIAVYGGRKRLRTAAAIAAWLDAGRDDPSIAELADWLGLKYPAVVAIVNRLADDGLLVVERGKKNVPIRYEIPAVSEAGR